MTISESLPKIKKAIRDVCKELENDSRKFYSWSSLFEDDLWRELVACILGSRVRFDVVTSAIDRMQKAKLFSISGQSVDFDKYEISVRNSLSGENNKQNQKYPFPRIKSTQIRTAAERFYANNETVQGFLNKFSDVYEVRRVLNKEVSGIGPKQASLFLRNIGFTKDIAVLDSHVLSYMNWFGLTKSFIKKVKNLNHYENLENNFINHCYSVGHYPDNYDVAIWVVVRLSKKDYLKWEL